MTKTMRSALFLFASIVALNTGVAVAAGDTARGETIATQGNGAGALACITCHGPDGKGNSAAGFPDIAGLNAGYFAKQLHDYANGARKNPIIVASSLSVLAVSTLVNAAEPKVDYQKELPAAPEGRPPLNHPKSNIYPTTITATWYAKGATCS